MSCFTCRANWDSKSEFETTPCESNSGFRFGKQGSIENRVFLGKPYYLNLREMLIIFFGALFWKPSIPLDSYWRVDWSLNHYFDWWAKILAFWKIFALKCAIRALEQLWRNEEHGWACIRGKNLKYSTFLYRPLPYLSVTMWNSHYFSLEYL